MFLPIIPIFLASQTPFWEAIANWYQNSLIYELLTYLEEKYFRVEFHVYEHIALGPTAGRTAQMLIIGIALGLILAAIVAAYTRAKLGGFLRKLIEKECLSEDAAKTLREVGEFRNASVRRALSRGTALKKYVRCVGDGEVDNGDTVIENANNSDGENASTVAENGDTVVENSSTVIKNADALTEENAPTVIENGDMGAEEAIEDAADAAGKSADDSSASVEADAEDTPATESEAAGEANASSAKPRGFWARLRRFFLGDDVRERMDFSTARFYIPKDRTDQIDARFARRRSDVLFTVLTVVAVVVCSSLLCTFLPDILQLMDNLIGMMAP